MWNNWFRSQLRRYNMAKEFRRFLRVRLKRRKSRGKGRLGV
jgi:hypothetical protein